MSVRVDLGVRRIIKKKKITYVGGGSNAIGIFHRFIDDPSVRLIGLEAGGDGVETGRHASSISGGSMGVLHGSRTYVLQDDDGQTIESHSISAGLDYPGIGPIHAHLFKSGRGTFANATDDEAMQAGFELGRLEGIIPAIETAHALAYLKKTTFKKDDVVVVNLSGRGDKDLTTYIKYFDQQKNK